VSEPSTLEAPVLGLVAILDALGAATYSREQVATFLRSRERAIEATRTKLESHLGRFDQSKFKIFTFNDTIILAYLPDPFLPEEVESFCHVLRAFQALSMQQGILFRGACAHGEFYEVSERTNTIMGPVISDAAAWYDKADWIGIHFTPRSAMYVDALGMDLSHVLVDYAVPLRSGALLGTKAINWPKAFYVQGLSPATGTARRRTSILSLLSSHLIPFGVESKYAKTVTFFDHVEATQKLDEQFGPQPSPSPALPESEENDGESQS
jgi:hypothetical protein